MEVMLSSKNKGGLLPEAAQGILCSTFCFYRWFRIPVDSRKRISMTTGMM